MDIKRIDSTENDVCKFIYTDDTAVFESVLYKYPNYKTRTVICCSTMSGCPIGCRFCGAGDYFVRNATADEIINQVEYSLSQIDCDPLSVDKLQIMFMSMGEPLLNKRGIVGACETLYSRYPNAALLLSSIAPKIDYGWLFELSERIPTIGLQFSIHKTVDEERNKLIPFDAKLSLKEISAVGSEWAERTGRKPYFNYCAGEDNSTEADAKRLRELFSPDIWEATISVICESNDGMPARNDYQRWLASDFSQRVLLEGFTVRVFDPAGQDDIGGGCGQLWGTQEWMKNNPDKARPSVGNGKPKIHVPQDIAPTMDMY
jgi:23S rRNA (adenine2503-C2)-methyltransferase